MILVCDAAIPRVSPYSGAKKRLSLDDLVTASRLLRDGLGVALQVNADSQDHHEVERDDDQVYRMER